MAIKTKKPNFAKLLFLAFCAYSIITLIILTVNITSLEKDIDILSKEKQILSSSVEKLTNETQQGANDEVLAKIAREKLGYASEGERIFIDTSSK